MSVACIPGVTMQERRGCGGRRGRDLKQKEEDSGLEASITSLDVSFAEAARRYCSDSPPFAKSSVENIHRTEGGEWNHSLALTTTETHL